MLSQTRIPATTPNKLQNTAANSRKELARDGRLVTARVCLIDAPAANPEQPTVSQVRRSGFPMQSKSRPRAGIGVGVHESARSRFAKFPLLARISAARTLELL